MKFLVLLLAVASVAHGKVAPAVDTISTYGYLESSIARAEQLRQAEEAYIGTQGRIVGGVPAGLGQYPYQAGLLINIVGFDGRGVCGGSLISANRVITAAHCWFDGSNQAWRVEVVLGSVTVFVGGNRQYTSVIANHPNFNPLLARNDVGVLYLPNNVPFTNTIAPIALPSGAELQDDFVDVSAFASGFGLTSDDGSINNPGQYLSHVQLRVITNSACRFAFPLFLHETNICTSGVGSVGTCRGDSGGPLVVIRNNRPVLIGVTSFGSALGCQANFPAAFARVTSFVPFFNQHL